MHRFCTQHKWAQRNHPQPNLTTFIGGSKMKIDHTSQKELIKKVMILATEKEKHEYSALATAISSIHERLREINVEWEKLSQECKKYGSVVTMPDEIFIKWSVNNSKTTGLMKESMILKVALEDLVDKEKWLLLSIALREKSQPSKKGF